MISIKTKDQLEMMREAGKILAQTLKSASEAIKPGVTTSSIDKLVEDNILAAGAKPAFKGYRGYPASSCISIDDEVVHGIPGSRKFQEGELVAIDIGVVYKGWHADSAATFPVGEISSAKKKLIDVTRESLERGIEKVHDGVKLGEISVAIQNHAESNGFSVVRELVGHGIGQSMHEEPQVPNYGEANEGPTLRAGMAIAIEPMVNAGEMDVNTKSDGWTVVTADGQPSAHFEHTIAVTESGAEILTKLA